MASSHKKTDKLVPNGTPDPELPVLCVLDESGAPMGMLASFACHLDCIGGFEYTGDYASELSRCLKAEYGNDFVSIYLAGASGDINHINAIAQTRSDYIEMGKALAAEVVRVPADISVISTDDIILSNMIYPGLTTVVLDKEKIGNRAVDMLIDLINHREVQNTVIASSDIIVRDSVKKM